MKKLVCFVIALVLLLAMCSAALAKNDKRDNAKMAKLEAMVVSANVQIRAAVLKAQLTIKDDVAWLLRKVDQITSRVFRYAASIDATVVCTYERYYVDGRYVMIDPLHVVYVGGGSGGGK